MRVRVLQGVVIGTDLTAEPGDELELDERTYRSVARFVEPLAGAATAPPPERAHDRDPNVRNRDPRPRARRMKGEQG